MKQAALLNGSSFDALAFEQNRLLSAKIDIRRRQIVDALMIAAMILVLDESLDVGFDIPRQIIVFQQDLVFQRLMPALDFALGLGMARRAANVIDVALSQPFGKIFGHIARAIV